MYGRTSNQEKFQENSVLTKLINKKRKTLSIIGINDSINIYIYNQQHFILCLTIFFSRKQNFKKDFH